MPTDDARQPYACVVADCDWRSAAPPWPREDWVHVTPSEWRASAEWVEHLESHTRTELAEAICMQYRRGRESSQLARSVGFNRGRRG